QHEVALRQRAVDRDHIAAELFEQRTYGSDPDPAGDEQDLRTRARVGGEDAERALGQHLRADLELVELRGVVAERLHRDPKRVALRRPGGGEGMRRVPEAALQEAPEEDLAGARAVAVDAAPRDTQRPDAGALLDGLRHAEAVAPVLDDRPGEPVPDDERGGR